MSIIASVAIRADSEIGMIVAEDAGDEVAMQIDLVAGLPLPPPGLFAITDSNLVVHADLGEEARLIRCVTATGSVIDVEIQPVEMTVEPEEE